MEAASRCCARNGMRFPLGRQAETPSQFDVLERGALSLGMSFRKLHPSLKPQNGDAFRMMLQAETATQNIASEWDAVSG